MAYFIQNPINKTVPVSPRTDATFHRVIATVTIAGLEFVHSFPVGNKTEAFFDFSSSLRAYANSLLFHDAAINNSYEQINFSVKFHEEYMKGGVLHAPDLAVNYDFSADAILGGFTDIERISGTVSANSAETASFTMRPSSPMLVPSGHSHLRYRRDGHTRIAKMSNLITAAEDLYYSNDNIYQVPDDGRWFEFQFINSRGLHESAFAHCYSTESIKGGSQTHVRALRETFSSVSRRLNINDPSTASLSFSSGFVDLPWAKWFAYEFCKANKHQQHWIKIDGLWVPCAVTLKDGATLINRSKTELLSVEFDVVPDVNGML